MIPTFEITSITPEIAKDWLRGQTNIRIVRPSRVAAYAADMAAGKWLMTGEAIAFNGTSLLNGFHRLNACIKSGVPFTAVVARNIPAAAVEAMDSGLTRSLADVLRSEGLPNVHSLAAVARILLAWERGILAESAKVNAMPRGDILDYARRNSEELARAVRAGNNLRFAVGGGGAALSASYFRLDPDFRDEFYQSLMTGANLPDGDARLALRNWLFNRASSSRAMPPYLVVAQIVKGWNFWISGKSAKAFKQHPRSLQIPEIEQP